MKTVGSHWIAEVPSGWRIDTPRFAFSVRGDRAKPGMEQMTASQQYGVIPQSEYVKKTGSHVVVVEKDFSILKAVYPGDFVIHMRSFQGGLELSEVKGCTSSAYVMLIPGPQIHSARYYRWVFKCDGYISELRSTSNLVRDGQALRWTNFIQVPIPFPPPEVQDSIALYLDRETERIEELRDSIRAQIDALEAYKRSVSFDAVTGRLDRVEKVNDPRIAWLGNVPRHWRIEKIKFHVTRNERKGYPDEPVLSLYRELGLVYKDSRDDNHNVTSADTSPYKLVTRGNLVINKMKAWQGSVAVSQLRGIVSPAYYVYKIDSLDLRPEYLHYLLRSSYKGEFRRMSGGIREGQWDLPAASFENTYILIPPVHEQDEIVAYLDRRLEAIDASLRAKERQLAILDGYKNSLIYEIVTGKREVPVR